MPNTSVKSNRLGFLDSVRGVAAFAVFIEHAGYSLFPNFRALTHNHFSFGKFGVTAFFLTSGFVIPFSLERGNSLLRFWISRFFRLYPLYWVSIAITVSLFLLKIPDVVTAAFAAHLWRNTLINLTMFQDFVRVPDAEELYYTLAMEMAFYFFVSALFMMKFTGRSSIRIAWGAYAALTSAAIAIPLLAHVRVPMAGLFYLLCFLVGTVVYRHFTGHTSLAALSALVLFVVAGAAAETYCNYALIKKDDLLEHYSMWAVLLPWASAYAFFLGAYTLRRFTFPAPLIWLGTISYSVYVLHPACIGLVSDLIAPRLELPAMLILTLVVSAISYRLIELPGIRLGKRLGDASKDWFAPREQSLQAAEARR